MLSKVAVCNYVKIQKRNQDVCVPVSQKTKRKDTPWREMSYLEYKHKIEFSEEQIRELFEFGELIGIELFASVLDKDSVDLMCKYTKITKLGSASINDLKLYARDNFDFLIMSTEKEIEDCINICNPDVIMHTKRKNTI